MRPEPKPSIPKMLQQALALHRQGQLAQAEEIYKRILQSEKKHFDAMHMLGVIAMQRKNAHEAVALIGRAIAINPNQESAHSNIAFAFGVLKQHEQALASCDRALKLKPNYVDAHNNRGNALLALQRYEEALACFDRTLALKPDHADAHNNRGTALRELRRYDDALASYAKALALKPDYVEAHYNAGNSLSELNRHEEALACYQRALALQPERADMRLNESICRLRLGDLETGLQEYERRLETETGVLLKRNFPQPLWLGNAPLAGKTILLHAEQGLGDTIQFIRYAGMVASQGATVLLEVPAALKTLLASVPGVTQIFVKGETLPAFDYYCPLPSLPLACQTRLHCIPAQDSYLRSDPVRVEEWRARLGPRSLPRIGLVWSGNATHKNDRNRSMPLAELVPLLSGRAEFFGVQKDVRAEDRQILGLHPELRHLGDELNDFADTAAVISLMDVVITVDTSVAHLAGALGKPVWILLPFTPDWRWLLDRADSPWYPTARLFRQTVRGDWGGVVGSVRMALSALDN